VSVRDPGLTQGLVGRHPQSGGDPRESLGGPRALGGVREGTGRGTCALLLFSSIERLSIPGICRTCSGSHARTSSERTCVQIIEIRSVPGALVLVRNSFDLFNSEFEYGSSVGIFKWPEWEWGPKNYRPEEVYSEFTIVKVRVTRFRLRTAAII